MKLIAIAVLALSCLTSAAPAAGKLKVVATIPDLADVASAVGGQRVEVTSICKGRENVHAVRPAPSHLVALSRADVLVQQGLALEGSWLPGLLMNARNKRIAAGAPGFVNVSEGWEAIEVPESVSRKGGDVHPFGNPHLNLDPRAGRHVAARVLAGLVVVDPAGREVYERNHAKYLETLAAAEVRWAELGAQLAGTRVVTYHQEFDYLARYHGIEVVGTIESKPGVPPTAAHLAQLIEDIEAREVGAILTATWSNDRQVDSVARRTGRPVIELPTMVGGAPGADTWIAMQDLIHARLVAVLAPEPPAREPARSSEDGAKGGGR